MRIVFFLKFPWELLESFVVLRLFGKVLHESYCTLLDSCLILKDMIELNIKYNARIRVGGAHGIDKKGKPYSNQEKKKGFPGYGYS